MPTRLIYQMKNRAKDLLPAFVLNGYHFSLALAAALLSGFPGKKMKVIAVTGTNGKSTVVEMLSYIFEEAGFKVASLSSIRFRILGREEVNDKRMTMPGRSFVQKFLKKAKDQGCSHVILEVTSEGIKQHRHRFIDFGAAVFTNLSPEHIESHGSFEKYRAAKGQLFRSTKTIHVLNLDDNNIDFFRQFPAEEKWGYGIKKNPLPGISHWVWAEGIETSAVGSSFSVDGVRFSLRLLGEFNAANALAAIATAQSQGIDLMVCQKALAKITGLPGRLEKVVGDPFPVFVDYAFTPNALEKVYQAIRSKFMSPGSQLVCVLGACGGGRDKWKRPVLGDLAARHCDQIVLTNEDPYDENPQEIIDQIASGAESIRINQPHQHQSVIWKIIDRREAINKALSLARPGDAVVITGKGCEPSICLAQGQRISWDDRQVVREELSKIINR